MPMMPPTWRPPGAPTQQQRRAEFDARRKARKPTHRWYSLAVWKRRREAQRRRQPNCERCLKRGKVVPMKVANHNPPHNGDWNAFINGPLESLCRHCDSAENQRQERAAEKARRAAAAAGGRAGQKSRPRR